LCILLYFVGWGPCMKETVQSAVVPQ
jgi:hypothetical protein